MGNKNDIFLGASSKISDDGESADIELIFLRSKPIKVINIFYKYVTHTKDQNVSFTIEDNNQEEPEADPLPRPNCMSCDISDLKPDPQPEPHNYPSLNKRK